MIMMLFQITILYKGTFEFPAKNQISNDLEYRYDIYYGQIAYNFWF